jgi:hypothetical protein
VIYRALSLKQPWAALLVAGRKTIEVRRWRTDHRGPVLVHAARIDDPRPQAWARVPDALRPLTTRRGGVIGVGELVECHAYADLESFAADQEAHCNDPAWFDPRGLFGFRFRDVRPLPFHPVPGFVRLFEVELALPAEEAGPPPAVRRRLGRFTRGGNG